MIRKPDDSTKGYDTLDAAMQAAQSGDTLILQNQVNVTSTITLKDGVTLDLNGQIGGNNPPVAINSTISPTFQIASGSSATIINSGNFTAISMNASASKVIQNNGTLTLGGNIKVSSTTASMISGGQISGNPIALMPHTRQYISTLKKDITIFHVAKPQNPANGSYTAQQGDTVQFLLDAFVKPTLDIKFYGDKGTLISVPVTEYQNCVWNLSTSPNDGSNIQPQDALENGIYTFTTEVFDYPLTYQVEVSGLTSAPTQIDAIAIEDIDAPVAGQALDHTANVQTEGVSVSSVSWEPQNTGTADYDTAYTIAVTLAPKSNYAFASAVTATINQENATVTNHQDGTITVRFTFPKTDQKTVQLQSIQQPDPIQAANGTQIQDLPLPTQVNIVTDDSSINQANVQWSDTPVDGTSYDPSEKTEQTFRLEGTMTLPEGVEANGVSLTVKIDVTVTAADVTAAPVANPPAGTYTSNQTVTLTTDTPDATIYYTTDGSEPTAEDGIEYNAPIAVEGREGESITTEIKAIAVAPDMQDSAVSTFRYTIKIPGIVIGTTAAPVAQPAAGVYTKNQMLVLTSDTPDATIYYTLDGSEPSANHGVQYTIPIALQGKAGETVYITVKAIAVSTLLQDSEVVTYEYELKLPATSGGGSSGGSSSGGSLKPGNSGSTVTTNPDGSKTETTTKPNGTKTETTTKPDGSQQITTTKSDGTSAITTQDTQGKQTATVTLPKQPTESVTNQNTVTLPIPDIHANRSPQFPATVKIQVDTDTTTKVRIPVTNAVPGTVAVLVHADGRKEILPTVVAKQNYMVVAISNDATIEIMDNSQTYYDVPETGWQKNAADFMSSRGLFAGTGTDTYSPNAPTQRAMLMTALARLDGQVITNQGGNWYDAGMAWAKQNQISDGSNPLQNVSREQLATMLYRYAQQKGVAQSSGNYLQNFTDQNDISAYAKEAMQWAVANNILYGNGNQLSPKNPATRAEVSAAIMRFCENVLSNQ